MRIPGDLRRRLLLAAAILLLLSAFSSWTIPVVKLLIALAVAFLAWHSADGASDSASSETDSKSGRLCRYAFSSAALDLTDSSSLPKRLTLQSAFSSVSVRLPVDAAITVRAAGAFCSVSMPGRQSMLIGEQNFRCGSQDPNAPKLHITVSCAFSSISLRMG